MKTPITYYGGKQAIIHHILPLIPEHEVYTEVFFGGGTVFFAKQPTHNETINDRLDMVVNFYKVLKTKYAELKILIDSSLLSKTTHREALAIIRNKQIANDVTRAWAFWYCSNFSFACKIGGGMKFSNDQRQTPAHQINARKAQFTEKFVERIENAHIENDDALKILNSRNVAKAFHYVDPPYYNADQGHYKGYTIHDYILLLEWLQHECKGKFLLSNYESDILNGYIERNHWNHKCITLRLAAPRKTGKVKTEVLVWNYNRQATLFD